MRSRSTLTSWLCVQRPALGFLDGAGVHEGANKRAQHRVGSAIGESPVIGKQSDALVPDRGGRPRTDPGQREPGAIAWEAAGQRGQDALRPQGERRWQAATPGSRAPEMAAGS